MNIVVAGGTGFIGRRLVRRLAADGHRVILLSRNPRGTHPMPGVECESWDGENAGSWSARLNGADAVVNLAGEPMAGGRWTKRRKRGIVESRIRATRAIIDAIDGATSRPRLLLNASAVGYYGSVPVGEVTERTPGGTGFLAETCRLWEAEAVRAEKSGLRVVLLRTGVVLGEKGGVLARMLIPFRLFAGGSLGDGRQWFPWIHADDAVEAALFALEKESLSGPLNLAAPEPATMESFCRTLGAVMQRPSWTRVPGWILKAALGEMAGMVLEGQKVIPEKLLRSGYRFRYTNVRDALADILRTGQ